MTNYEMNDSGSLLPPACHVKRAARAWELAAAMRLLRDSALPDGANAIFIVAVPYGRAMLQEAQRAQAVPPDHTRNSPPPAASACPSCAFSPEVAGAIRIHEETPGVWHASALSMKPEYRSAGVLAPALIRLAATIANARGARAFFARVRNPDVPVFQQTHFRALRTETLHTQPDCLMQADLARYPAWHSGNTGFLVTMRRAA